MNLEKRPYVYLQFQNSGRRVISFAHLNLPVKQNRHLHHIGVLSGLKVRNFKKETPDGRVSDSRSYPEAPGAWGRERNYFRFLHLAGITAEAYLNTTSDLERIPHFSPYVELPAVRPA